MERIRDTGVMRMSEKDVEIETKKGNIKIPWKVVLIVLGIAAAALGIGEDAFNAIIDAVEG